jgi:hypothetical protein
LVRNPSRYEAFWIYGVGVCIFFSFLFHQLSFVLSSDFYVMWCDAACGTVNGLQFLLFVYLGRVFVICFTFWCVPKNYQ